MKEWIKSFGVVSVLIVLFIGNLVYQFISFKNNEQESLNKANSHIKTVMLIDRNCNECHLGESFINLFNHPVVKANDNVINKMMDNAKIKRW